MISEFDLNDPCAGVGTVREWDDSAPDIKAWLNNHDDWEYLANSEWEPEAVIYDFRLDRELEREFRELADEWRRATGAMSIISKKIMHPAYQRIMAKGPDVLPLILRELRCRPGYWFWALSSITGENPVRPEATFDQAVEDWLNWGRNRNLID